MINDYKYSGLYLCEQLIFLLILNEFEANKG